MQTEQQFDDLAASAWEGILEREPLMGTFVGDDRYDDRLADPSEAGRAAEEAMARANLKALAAIDRSTLDEGRQITAHHCHDRGTHCPQTVRSTACPEIPPSPWSGT